MKAFRVVGRCGSFTTAARQLGITTAAVSKSVGRLEDQLETRLFKRSTRQVSLTDEGRLFLKSVNAALDTLDEGMDRLHEHRHQPEGVISIATATAFGKDHLLRRLGGFLDHYPRIRLDVHFNDCRIDLIREGYDLSLQVRDPLEQTYIARALCELPLVLVASPEYLSRRGIPGSVADLKEHECITLRHASGRIAAWEFHRLVKDDKKGVSQEQVEPHQPDGRLLITGQYDAVLDSALAGLGITATYAESVLRYLKTGELKVLLPDYQVMGGGKESNQICLCYPHKEYLSYNVRTLIDYLVASFRDFPELKLRNEWIARPGR
jgi:DNA-binding transcriptional LysR family regulator